MRQLYVPLPYSSIPQGMRFQRFLGLTNIDTIVASLKSHSNPSRTFAFIGGRFQLTKHSNKSRGCVVKLQPAFAENDHAHEKIIVTMTFGSEMIFISPSYDSLSTFRHWNVTRDIAYVTMYWPNTIYAILGQFLTFRVYLSFISISSSLLREVQLLGEGQTISPNVNPHHLFQGKNNIQQREH